MSKYFVNFNANKWGKDHGDCAIRALVMGIGMDYEYICKKLGVPCKVGEGYIPISKDETEGVDLEVIKEKFNTFLGDEEDWIIRFPDADPYKLMLNAPSLEICMKKNLFAGGKYLVYLDDNTEMDGGHIVYVNGFKNYFIDTQDCSKMGVQSWIKIKKEVPAKDKYHFKYDTKTKTFF